MTTYDRTAETVLATTAAEGPGRALGITTWVFQILLGAFMIVASGAPKLFAVEAAATGFDMIGWGDWFMYLVGALEIAGGIGLLIPRVSGLAAIGLSLLMIGAAIFNAALLDFPVLTPLILLAFFAGIAWVRRHQTQRFLKHGFKSVR
ncbi:DoxX family protein [Glycomyces niveus]|uniref:DoxX family protein n=1 Tax=Glycomyces niveus TaxID=2820287 RepID=A0ABS3U1A8_9ACTN|nr:DoxX family protein [Glycomyces sp. NEAU-S30]MBO3732061.1 DoxX family protein [Glycomyces sp. NEAU-S30]